MILSGKTDRPSSLVERLADEMGVQWDAGNRPLVEDFLARYPALAADPEAVLDLIAEELALREEFEEALPAEAMADRFPHLTARIHALAHCQRVIGPRPPPVTLPNVGEEFGEFRLLTELGRGAAGRVFLAVQPALGDRAVVLKVTPDLGHEHLSLARLQHTHVVPLYSAHEFPDRGLRALCLPYFGGATLADLAGRMPADRAPTGADFVDALRAVQTAVPVPVAVGGGPACAFLQKATLAEAACWVGACLADALQYAHDRGLLHMDIKPSNVLLAADGLPMLLDFHLARPPLRAGDPPPAWIGGTHGFMAPEQADAVRAVRERQPLPRAVDGRADLYSLGVLLTTLLKPARGSLPVGLADVLARCTAPDAKERYPAAADLAADLRRHLADLPLRGVGNRSVVERWRKWRRRRPLALPLGLAVAALAGGAWVGVATFGQQADRARAALHDGQEFLAQQRYADAIKSFRGGEEWVGRLPFQEQLAGELRDGRARAERSQAVAELHRFVERVRPLFGLEELTPGQVRAAAAACREVWDRRADIPAPDAGTPPDLAEQRRRDVLDLGILTAHLVCRAAPPEQAKAGHEQALAVLDQTEAAAGPSGVLYLERESHARSLGAGAQADEWERLAQSHPPRSAWDFLARGRTHLAAGDYRQAAQDLNRSLALDPGSIWAGYHLGRCLLELDEPTEAVAAFTTCLDRSPNTPSCWYNRGLAFAAADRPARAQADFDRALELDPRYTPALLARAVAFARQEQPDRGLADLKAADAAGASVAEVQYHLASIHLAVGERPAALTSLRAALRSDPAHRKSKDLLLRFKPK